MRRAFYLVVLMSLGAAAVYAEEAVKVPPATSAPATAAPVMAVTATTAAESSSAAPDAPATPVLATAPAAMPTLTVALAGLLPENRIPEKFAYCAPDTSLHTKDGGNRNPEIRWSKGPEATKSYAVLAVDPDVPTVFDDANQVGKTIPDALPRQNFYHWVLVDIPPAITDLPEGIDSSGVNKQGKPVGAFAYGIRGANDYGKFLGGSPHGGYDGPCPPWNDERVHHYHFIVYALDVPTLGLSGQFVGPTTEAAMAGHILAKGEAVGTYTQNTHLPETPAIPPHAAEAPLPTPLAAAPTAPPPATSPETPPAASPTLPSGNAQ